MAKQITTTERDKMIAEGYSFVRYPEGVKPPEGAEPVEIVLRSKDICTAATPFYEHQPSTPEQHPDLELVIDEDDRCVFLTTRMVDGQLKHQHIVYYRCPHCKCVVAEEFKSNPDFANIGGQRPAPYLNRKESEK